MNKISSSGTAPLRSDVQVIGLVGFAHGISHFFHLILAPLFPWLKDEFGVSYAALGLLMTAFFVVSGLCQVLAGFVVDRIGARAVLFFGMTCLGMSALVLASAQSYAMLMAGSMLAGLGNGIFHPSDFTLLNRRVSPARLGHAFSIHGVSGNLGWAAAPLFLVGIAGFAGWRTALLAAAALPFVALAILCFYSAQLHYELDDVSPRSADSGTGKARESATAFMRRPAVWMCFAFFLISALALGAIQSFSAPALRALYGMPLAWATVAYSAFMLASAGGTLWGGVVASKTTLHARTIGVAFLTAALTSCLLATGLPPAFAAVGLMAVIGFASGVAGPSRDMLIREASPKNATGRVYGVVYSGLDVGLATAPLVFGAMMDAARPAWIFIGVGLLQAGAVLTAVSVSIRNAKSSVGTPKPVHGT